MNMPTNFYETGPPDPETPTSNVYTQPMDVRMIGNMYAFTRQKRFLLQLQILAQAGDTDAEVELKKQLHLIPEDDDNVTE